MPNKITFLGYALIQNINNIGNLKISNNYTCEK